MYIHTTDVHNFSAAEIILPYILKNIHIESVIDIGCGTGTWLKVAKDLGIKRVVGYDGFYVDTKNIHIDKNEFIAINLTNSIQIEHKYDLALCLEVLEHLPDDAGVSIVENLCKCSKFILFSAAIPGQGGQDHINEKDPNIWKERICKYGFSAYDVIRPMFWNNDKIDWWYKQNMILYIDNRINNPFDGYQLETINSYIHPKLLEYKNQQINWAENELFNPNFGRTFRRLIKSFFSAKS